MPRGGGFEGVDLPDLEPIRTAVQVVGAAILDGARCLVARRCETMTLPLKWEFPCGKVVDGEDPAVALEREIAEELALEVEVLEYLGRGRAGMARRRRTRPRGADGATSTGGRTPTSSTRSRHRPAPMASSRSMIGSSISRRAGTGPS